MSINTINPINTFYPATGYVTLDQFNEVVNFFKAELAEVKADLLETKELLAISLKRNTVLEKALFSHDSEGELVLDENESPVLSQNHTRAKEKPAETEPEVTPTIETTLDLKACAVVEYLKEEMKPNDFGEFVIGRKELSTFMQGIIEEGLRVKKVSRQLKADLFERAVKLFPSIVYIRKSSSGNKTKMLALKTSQKRTITYGMTRTAPIGILA
jgi:hypothetical protein